MCTLKTDFSDYVNYLNGETETGLSQLAINPNSVHNAVKHKHLRSVSNTSNIFPTVLVP